MNHIILLTFTILLGQTAFAQKEYIDPSVKEKRPLLESEEGSSSKKSELAKAPMSSSTEDKKVVQYCACVNSQRLTAQAGELHYQMYVDGHVESREYYHLSLKDKADEKKKLINLFVNREELEVSEIDCEVARVSSTNFRTHLKEIEKFDDICKFEEIKRKKY